MALTDLALRNAKPREKAYKLFDGGGLHLLINPNGSRIWRLAYGFVGKPKQLSFGPYPTVSLADARQKREEAKKLLLDGKDPSTQRKLDKVHAAIPRGDTFANLAADYIERLRTRDSAPSTIAKNKWLLETLAGPALGPRPVGEITPVEILAVLQQVERSGRHESARRLRSAIGSVYRFAIATLRAETDPTFALRDALERPKVKHRSALTDPKALGGLMRAIDEYDGWPNLAIDSKLRGCDLVALKVGDVFSGSGVRSRSVVIQRKTEQPVPFEITEPTKDALAAWLAIRRAKGSDWLWPSRGHSGGHVTTRQYGRLVDQWVSLIGLNPADYGTHSLRRTKVSILYKRTGNLRACQLLLGHTKLESTVHYLGIEVDDALSRSEQTEI